MPAIPGYVQRDPRVRVTACEEYYPPSDSVPTWGVSDFVGLYPRQVGDFACYYPFIDPDTLRKSPSLNERRRQCQLQGGTTFGREAFACQADRGLVWCDAGWLYFDQYCYYKPDGFLDANMITTLSDAEAACVALEPLSTASWSPSRDVYLWMALLVQYKPDATKPMRVTLSDGFCDCFVYAPANATTNATTAFQYTATTCNCDDPYFPACRYHHALKPQVLQDVSMSAAARTLMRDGQDGVPHRGEVRFSRLRSLTRAFARSSPSASPTTAGAASAPRFVVPPRRALADARSDRHLLLPHRRGHAQRAGGLLQPLLLQQQRPLPQQPAAHVLLRAELR